MGNMTSSGKTSAAAIVAAGGSGKRMGGGVPKQLLEIRNKPILFHTLSKLERVPEIGVLVLAVPAANLEDISGRIAGWNFDKKIIVVGGGAERQDSVRRALEEIPENAEVVLVHDAVRPFVTIGKIREILFAACRDGAAIPALRVRNTVKKSDGDWVEETVDRRSLYEVQTPQAFRREILIRAHAKAGAEGFRGTDDSQLVERLGLPVRIVAGEECNIKITSPGDMRLAEILAQEESCG
jgi:2-C-methyl-D-erythritol 4-phosphate cytidylyltransferase